MSHRSWLPLGFVLLVLLTLLLVVPRSGEPPPAAPRVEPLGAVEANVEGDRPVTDLHPAGRRALTAVDHLTGEPVVGFRLEPAPAGLEVVDSEPVPAGARRVVAPGYHAAITSRSAGEVRLVRTRPLVIGWAHPPEAESATEPTFALGLCADFLALNPGLADGDLDQVPRVVGEVVVGSSSVVPVPVTAQRLEIGWPGRAPGEVLPVPALAGLGGGTFALAESSSLPAGEEDSGIPLVFLPERSVAGFLPARAPEGSHPVGIYACKLPDGNQALQHRWVRSGQERLFVSDTPRPDTEEGVPPSLFYLRARGASRGSAGVLVSLGRDVRAPVQGQFASFGELAVDGDECLELLVRLEGLTVDDLRHFAEELDATFEWDGETLPTTLVDRTSLNEQRVGTWSSFRLTLGEPTTVCGLRPGVHSVDLDLPEVFEELQAAVPIEVTGAGAFDLAATDRVEVVIAPVPSDALTFVIAAAQDVKPGVLKLTTHPGSWTTRRRVDLVESGGRVTVVLPRGTYFATWRSTDPEHELCWAGSVSSAQGTVEVTPQVGRRLVSDFDRRPVLLLRDPESGATQALPFLTGEAVRWRSGPVPAGAEVATPRGAPLSDPALGSLGIRWE